MPDTELMARVKRGDKDAFVAIVHRHQNPLLNFFRRMGVYNDAEDLVQDTLVRLFNYRHRYEPRAKFTTFLYLLARQVWIDTLRKSGRRREFTETLKEERAVAAQKSRHDEGLLADVEAALHELPEPMRMVIALSIFQGLKYDEVAEILDVPTGTVKSRMFNAIRRLRKNLDARRRSH